MFSFHVCLPFSPPFPSYFVLTLFLCEIFTGSGRAAFSRRLYPGHTVLQYTPPPTHIDTHMRTCTRAYTHRHFNCRVITHTMTGKWESTEAQMDGAKFLPPSLSLSLSLSLSIRHILYLSRSSFILTSPPSWFPRFGTRSRLLYL